MVDLKLDFCTHEAAKHAVLRWHYSRAMPSAKLVRIGVWEAKRFVGAILYGCGANRHLSRPFGLEPPRPASWCASRSRPADSIQPRSVWRSA
ncbi:MAG: hypothetical protein HC897_02890 [Thermoanaerobaculia bacterium]|nr:hypothetical protein [Thermoanaerobaculia bacterium]